MKKMKQIAMDLFGLEDEKPCLCGGGHEVCLHCAVCRAKQPDEMPTDFDDLAKYIDHTLLKTDGTEEEVVKLCEEAEEFHTKAVCVNPLYVEIASWQLSEVLVCSVVGFPLGACTTDTVLFETSKAISQGAEEIDMVIKVGALKSGDIQLVEGEISALASICHHNGVQLKVILENCLLTEEEKITACLLAKYAGADYVKTSTGMNAGGATVEDVKLMRTVVGPKIGVKAAGGIRTRQDAIAMLKAGANRIGASKTGEILKK